MEKRKAYIITAFIILLSLVGLSFWYVYIAKQELEINQVTDLSFYDTTEGIRPNTPNITENTAPQNENTYTNNQLSLNETTLDETISTSTDTTKDTPTTEESESWELIRISQEPSVGIAITDGVVKFIDQKTGNIYKSNKGAPKERISKTIIQYIQKAYILPNNTIFAIKNDGSIPILITKNDDEYSITDTQITDDLLQTTQSKQTIYYTTPQINGGVAIKSIEGTNTPIWNSHLSGWNIQATGEYIAVTQYASQNIPGYAYLIPQKGITTNKELIPVVQDAPGLITNFAPDASQLLYSTSDKKGTKLYLKNITTKDTIPLTIKTLVSKCAWSDDSITVYCAIPDTIPTSVPDSWYKGLTHFNDSLWRINTKTGDAFELVNGTGLDIINIMEDTENSDMLIFTNKFDNSLWAVRRVIDKIESNN